MNYRNSTILLKLAVFGVASFTFFVGAMDSSLLNKSKSNESMSEMTSYFETVWKDIQFPVSNNSLYPSKKSMKKKEEKKSSNKKTVVEVKSLPEEMSFGTLDEIYKEYAYSNGTIDKIQNSTGPRKINDSGRSNKKTLAYSKVSVGISRENSSDVRGVRRLSQNSLVPQITSNTTKNQTK